MCHYYTEKNKTKNTTLPQLQTETIHPMKSLIEMEITVEVKHRGTICFKCRPSKQRSWNHSVIAVGNSCAGGHLSKRTIVQTIWLRWRYNRHNCWLSLHISVFITVTQPSYNPHGCWWLWSSGRCLGNGDNSCARSSMLMEMFAHVSRQSDPDNKASNHQCSGDEKRDECPRHPLHVHARQI